LYNILNVLKFNDAQSSAKELLKAIEYLKENNQITTGVYQNLFEITDRTALRDLNELLEYRVIKKVGEKKGTKYLLN
jgi:ATP-dependent DNA helicase RecG